VRRFAAVEEFAVEVYRERAMDELELQLEVVGEPADAVCAAVAREVWVALGIRPRVRPVPSGSLPRFELKARRVRDRRKSTEC
jgi:phenylacetate-CoA ligase